MPQRKLSDAQIGSEKKGSPFLSKVFRLGLDLVLTYLRVDFNST